MSRNANLLPIARGSALDDVLRCYAEAWRPVSYRWPTRSAWLSTVENVLGLCFPDSSSADRRLTARWYAPFPLEAGHNVP